MMKPNRESERRSRTPDDYLSTIDPDVLASLSAEQLAAVTAAIDAAIPKPAPKLVDLRFGVDLIVSRFYVVLFVGKDRRQQRRAYPVPTRLAKVGNAIAAVVLLVGINLLVSLVLFLAAYLFKSAIGVDLFPDAHLGDQLEKL